MPPRHTVRGMQSMPLRQDLADESLLTPDEVCRLVRISPRTLIRWDRAGVTSPVRLPNGYRRYRRAEVEALLQAQPAAAPTEPRR